MESNSFSNPERAFAMEIVRELSDAGFQALWAGGCVRDLLMGNQPSDFDVATSASPDEVRRLFGKQRTIAVGAAFGVIIVIDSQHCGFQIEVATFRQDLGYSDGRRPDAVRYTTAEEDAKRRDFTINGMFYDPLAEKLIDYVGGQEDLRKGLIRAIGSAADRFQEDKLRMLRAVRFASRFGFAIEEETFLAIQIHSQDLQVVSAERIAAEVKKTLETPAARWAVETWIDTGMIRAVLPELEQQLRSQPLDFISIYDKSTAKSWIAALGWLLWNLDNKSSLTELATTICRRLKLSNDEESKLQFSLASQTALGLCTELPWSQSQPILANSRYVSSAIDLLTLRIAANEVAPSILPWIKERLAWPEEKLRPMPWITGQTLIEAGIRPSPLFKTILEQAWHKQLDGELASPEEAIKWLDANLSGG